MAGWADKRPAAKLQVAAGVVALVVAFLWLVWGIGRLAWLDVAMRMARLAHVHAVPVLLVLLAVYVVWAWRKGRFDGLRFGRTRQVELACSTDDRRVAGVCGGLARSFGLDATSVRTVSLGLLLLVPAVAALAYLFAAIALYPR